MKLPTCHLPQWIDPETDRCEHPDHDLEAEDVSEDCERPGRYGCQACPACLAYGDDLFHADR